MSYLCATRRIPSSIVHSPRSSRARPRSPRRAPLLVLALLLVVAAPLAAQVDVVITADNAYGFGYGPVTGIASGNYFGGIENTSSGDIISCPVGNGPEAYMVPSPQPGDYLYIASWSDDEVTQGVLGQFKSGANPAVYTGQGPWEVYATGMDFDLPSGGPTLAQINLAIADANAGVGTATTSGTWVGTTQTSLGHLVFGENNSSAGGDFQIVCATAIDAPARWMWFNRDQAQPPAFAFKNGNHKEFLIFRLPVGAVPGVVSCAKIGETEIDCRGQNGGVGTFSYGFTFTNTSPFAASATSLTITSTDVTGITPSSPLQLAPPIPPSQSGAVTGTFAVANPQPGGQACLDVRVFGGSGASEWCCPAQRVCFRLPECRECAEAKAAFKCRKSGARYLELTVTNNGPSPAQALQVFSTTPGVVVTPTNTPLALASGATATVQLDVSGAAAGQTIDLVVHLHGPTNPETGAFLWCCTSSLQVVVPRRPCPPWIFGGVYHDANLNGQRDAGEEGIGGWTVALTEGRDRVLTTAVTDPTGAFHFEVDPGVYLLSARPRKGWRPTAPREGAYEVRVEEPTERRFEFGFARGEP